MLLEQLVAEVVVRGDVLAAAPARGCGRPCRAGTAAAPRTGVSAERTRSSRWTLRAARRMQATRSGVSHRPAGVRVGQAPAAGEQHRPRLRAVDLDGRRRARRARRSAAGRPRRRRWLPTRIWPKTHRDRPPGEGRPSCRRLGMGVDGDAAELQRQRVTVDQREHPQRGGRVARGHPASEAAGELAAAQRRASRRTYRVAAAVLDVDPQLDGRDRSPPSGSAGPCP